MGKLRLCALGSSFASGPGIAPLEVKAAGRSSKNYAHLLAQKLGADLTDLSCSGATLLHVLDTPQDVLLFSSFPPQVDGVPADADIVTLTCGGNDLGYSGSMIMRSMESYSPFSLGGGGDDADETVSIEELTRRFVAVIDSVKQKAAKATVILVDYLPVFGEKSQTGKGTPLSQHQIARFIAQATKLSLAYRQAAESRPGTLLLAPGEWSRGHEVGSEEPWMEGFSLSMLTGLGAIPYHPNAAGHGGVAEELFKLVQEAVIGKD